jgi:hypothetical protein
VQKRREGLCRRNGWAEACIFCVTCFESRTYEASVKGTGEGYIGSALNKRSTIGEEGDGVGWSLEAEEKIVEANVAVRGEAVAHGGEVNGAVVLVDLDGVAAA